jgi:MgtE intracellular N domain/TIR domain
VTAILLLPFTRTQHVAADIRAGDRAVGEVRSFANGTPVRPAMTAVPVFTSRLSGRQLLDSDGLPIGRVRDVVILPTAAGDPPWVLGLMVTWQRRPIFINLGRVAEISIDGVHLLGGAVDLRRFSRPTGEILASELYGQSAGTGTVLDVGIVPSQRPGGGWEVSSLAISQGRRNSTIVPWDEHPELFKAGPLAEQLIHLREMHPTDLANAVETMSATRRRQLAAALQDDALADVLEEMPEQDQVRLLASLGLERSADVVEEMEPDDDADLPAEMPTERKPREEAEREVTATAAPVAKARAQREAQVQTPHLHRVKIFLCYRREDTQWFAGRIYDKLVGRYGKEQVFRDIDSTPSGIRYSTWIESRVSQSTVMIVLIGNAWLSAKDPAGQRRLDSPKDWVRREIEAALRHDIPIIPVRMQEARMPSEEELPSSIADLIEFQDAEVTDRRWAYDVGQLIQAIDGLNAEERAQRESEEQAPSMAEQIIYDSRRSATLSHDFVGAGRQNWTGKGSEGGYVGGKAHGTLSIQEGGVINIYRTDNNGKYEIRLRRYSYGDRDDNVILPKNPAISGRRDLRVSCEAKVMESAHTLRFVLKEEPTGKWLEHQSITVSEKIWRPINLEFTIDPTVDSYLRIDDYDLRSIPSMLQIRNILVTERK